MKPSDSPIVKRGLPISTYREAIENSGKSAEEKVAALSVLLKEEIEPLADGYVRSLTRCKRGQERAAAAKRAKKAPHVELLEVKAKILLAAGEQRRGLAGKIKRKYSEIKRSVQTINAVLRGGGI